METEPLVRAFQYVRISQDWEKRRLGVDRQKLETAELAERKGWTITGVYEDNNVSASRYSKKLRLDYQRLLIDIAAGQYEAGVFWDQDRLVRKPMELEEFVLICEKGGVRLLASIGDSIDLSTGDGLLILRIKGAVAAEESRKISSRARSKRRELIEAGKQIGGPRTFGYRYENRQLVIDPEEAKRLRSGIQRALAGESLRSICVSWNELGVLTSQGKNLWTGSTLQRLLISPRIAGYNKAGVKGEWEPIIDRETHERLLRILDDPARKRRAPIRKYLLTGLVYCQTCKARMVSQQRSTDKAPTYLCSRELGRNGCGKRRILALPLEDLVSRAVTLTLDSPELAAARNGRPVTDQTLGSLEAALQADRTSLEEASDDYYVKRVIDRESFFKTRSVLEGRIKAGEKQLVSLQPTNIQWDSKGAQLWDEWGSLSLGTRRAIIETIVGRIWIGTARRGVNKFDPNRVFIDWLF